MRKCDARIIDFLVKECGKILGELVFSKEQQNKTLRNRWRMRIQVAKVIHSDPDLLHLVELSNNCIF